MKGNVDHQLLKKAYEFIEGNPGSSATEVAEKIGLSGGQNFYSMLTTMENNGYLLSEKFGRYFAFRNINNDGRKK